MRKLIGVNKCVLIRFEDLRIRREKRKEGRKLAPAADKAATKEGHSDKVACLLFIATLETEQGPIVLKAQSKPISLSKLITLYAIILELILLFLYLCSYSPRTC